MPWDGSANPPSSWAAATVARGAGGPPLSSSMGQVAISCCQAVRLGPAEPAPEGQAGRRGPMTRVLAALAILVTLAGPAGAESLRSTGKPSIRHIYRTAPSLVGLGG